MNTMKNPSQDAMSAGQETCVDFVMQPAMKQKELIWKEKRRSAEPTGMPQKEN